MPSSTNSPVLYPAIVCPLPRRSHSHPYHHYHHLAHLHHHHHSYSHPRNRRTPSISSSPTTRHSAATPLSRSPSLSSHPIGLPPSSPLPCPEKQLSKLAPEDDVLSEFLSLFSPASPTLVAISPPGLPTPENPDGPQLSPKPPTRPAGHRPPSSQARSRLWLGATDEQTDHVSWIVSSPISRCHNPLPRHAELDALAARLAEPLQDLTLDRAPTTPAEAEALTTGSPLKPALELLVGCETSAAPHDAAVSGDLAPVVE